MSSCQQTGGFWAVLTHQVSSQPCAQKCNVAHILLRVLNVFVVQMSQWRSPYSTYPYQEPLQQALSIQQLSRPEPLPLYSLQTAYSEPPAMHAADGKAPVPLQVTAYYILLGASFGWVCFNLIMAGILFVI